MRDALAGRGQLFDNHQIYRRAVDERLFQLGARRHDALMDTLIQLRQPQLLKKPDETGLSNALSESLPLLPPELLGDVAEALAITIDLAINPLLSLEAEALAAHPNEPRPAEGALRELVRHRRQDIAHLRQRHAEVSQRHGIFEDKQGNVRVIRSEMDN